MDYVCTGSILSRIRIEHSSSRAVAKGIGGQISSDQKPKKYPVYRRPPEMTWGDGLNHKLDEKKKIIEHLNLMQF